jgi:hypothetical protein
MIYISYITYIEYLLYYLLRLLLLLCLLICRVFIGLLIFRSIFIELFVTNYEFYSMLIVLESNHVTLEVSDLVSLTVEVLVMSCYFLRFIKLCLIFKNY